MDRCAGCGAAVAATASWCGQCFAPRAATPTAGATAVFAPATPATLPPSVRRSRWQKTPTTFGPLGRVALSVALLVPLAVMVIGGFGDFFAWGGAAFYGAVIMPWALRDIWKSGIVPTG